MDRNIFTEEHDLFRRNVRAWVDKEIVPYKDVWEEANIVPRELWKAAARRASSAPGSTRSTAARAPTSSTR